MDEEDAEGLGGATAAAAATAAGGVGSDVAADDAEGTGGGAGTCLAFSKLVSQFPGHLNGKRIKGREITTCRHIVRGRRCGQGVGLEVVRDFGRGHDSLSLEKVQKLNARLDDDE